LSANGIRLSLSTLHSRRTAVAEAAGRLRAARSRLSSVFEYGIELADSDVFVAVGQSIQRRTLFGANPEPNDWYTGFVRSDHYARCASRVVVCRT